MRFAKTWMLLGALTLSATGCVAQTELDQTREAYRQAQEQVIDLQNQLEEAERRIASLQSGAGDEAASRDELRRLRDERDQLRQALGDMESQLRELGSAAGALPAELDSELERLAASNPELMSYDSERGMIRFRSDFTFGLGSADVRDDAASSLRELARVLQSDAARPYEIRIVGHTDNVPIGNPATRERHPTNWHLSAHRAIAVKDVLESAGLPPVRMNVSGYSEYRPIEPHRSGGVEANRRVEIYLVAMPPSVREAAGRSEQRSDGQGEQQQSQQRRQTAPQPEADNDADFK
ncbi:OmpA family protein [Phycisphaerales bacterium AB-hyl4]|uniref:OmpA family protein n=1 Tax=Natronomicrosphaera hydrolytica TaxID=3242702 RepID=A0ABV4U6F3_9BACT